jgi:hypothetical protein
VGDCKALCENVSSLECSDTVDACVSDCQAEEADLPPGCEDEWQAALTCATEAEWTCSTLPCDSAPGLPCEVRPRVVGCEAESEALGNCDRTDDCASGDAGSTVLDEQGRVVDYSWMTLCEECATPSVDGGGDECAGAEECEEMCCDCTDLSLTAHVCIDGVCANATEACEFACGTLSAR